MRKQSGECDNKCTGSSQMRKRKMQEKFDSQYKMCILVNVLNFGVF